MATDWYPNDPNPTFGEYADIWLSRRALQRATRANYRRLLDRYVLPTFGTTRLRDITPRAVQAWYDTTTLATPTVRTKAYSVLRSILRTAAAAEIIQTNPCQITNAASHPDPHTHLITGAEIAAITAAMPEAYQLVILMAAWLAMPFSELRELRRKDIDLARRVVRVRRAVARTHSGTYIATTPTSPQGIRDIAIPAHLLPTITAHLRTHVHAWPESLLFPCVHDRDEYLPVSKLDSMFHLARTSVGRPGLRVRDLYQSATLDDH